MKSFALVSCCENASVCSAEHSERRERRCEEGVPARQRQGGGAHEHDQQAADAARDAAARVHERGNRDDVEREQQRHAGGARYRVAFLVGDENRRQRAVGECDVAEEGGRSLAEQRGVVGRERHGQQGEADEQAKNADQPHHAA